MTDIMPWLNDHVLLRWASKILHFVIGTLKYPHLLKYAHRTPKVEDEQLWKGNAI